MKVPPVVQTISAAALAWVLGHVVPLWYVEAHVSVVAIGVSVAIALVFLGSALLRFRSQGTTVDPMNPNKAQSLVVTGIYKVTRNPMYVGFVCLLAAWCFYLGYLSTFLTLPVFVFVMTHFQIKAEERALEAKFGTDYTSYMRRVRRWL